MCATLILVATPGGAHSPGMSAYFDEDLFDFSAPDSPGHADSGHHREAGPLGAEQSDFEDEPGDEELPAVSGASSNSDELGNGFPGDGGSQDGSRRRKRGSRGGSRAGSATASTAKARWRSGAIPSAPVFDGNIEQDPYCLRHYRRRLMRWVRITKEFLPANEQALRALEQLRGEAEQEFEEVDDARFDCPEGIARLLSDLEVSFGERELFRQGGTIREFEALGRMQGEKEAC